MSDGLVTGATHRQQATPLSQKRLDEQTVAIDAYDILGYQAAIGAAPDDVGTALRGLLRGFGPIDVGHALHLPRYEIVPDSGMWHLRINGAVVQQDKELLASFTTLEWHVINAALARRDDLFQLHAAALCLPTRRAGIVLAGNSGSGKSTLALALMLRGFVPFTDDVTLFDRTTREIQALRRAFHISAESRQLVERFMGVPISWGEDAPTGHFVPPQWAERPVPIRWILFIEYKPDRVAELIPLSPSDAATAILSQTLNLSRTARQTLATTVRLVEEVGIFRLLTGDLQASVAIVQRLAAGYIQPTT